MVKLKPFKRMPMLVGTAVILAACALRLIGPELLERLELMTYDMRARAAASWPAPVATNLGFVFVDEESIKKVWDGSFGYRFGLYWPRQVYGRVVDELYEEGAKTIAFDVIFGEVRPDHTPVRMAGPGADGVEGVPRLVESDEFLAMQMARASNVLLAVTRDRVPPELFLTNAAGRGDISTDKDPDGILRKARAFRVYRHWHAAFRQVESDPGYGIDLARARVEARRIVLPRRDGTEIVVPIDELGEFALADFFGEKLPEGMPARAQAVREERVWHMGLVIAARELGLDLDKAEIDLAAGRIRLRGAGGAERVLPVDREAAFYIDWRLPPNHSALTQEPIHALLERNAARLRGEPVTDTGRWRGRSAVVGSAAVLGNDLADRGATPVSPDTLLVSKHWNVANMVISGSFVRRCGLWLELGLILLLGGASALVTWQLRTLAATGAVAVLAVGYIALAAFLYVQTRIWLPLVYPVVGALAVEHVTLLTWRVLFEQREQRRVKSVFSSIVSPKIVHELLRAESLSLGGARREVSIMFADVRGFTELTDSAQEQVAAAIRDKGLNPAAAEALHDQQARETLETVNLYLGIVADTIIAHDGTLDKFIGDCVMAFWGAPAANARHATACVRAAVEAQRAVERLNRTREAENRRREQENPERLAAGQAPLSALPILVLGTGINTGMATVGLMGSVDKVRNYTVFGREVNLASRLEGQSGRGRIYISEATLQHLRRDAPGLAATCIQLPPLMVKGIRSAVQVYEVPWRSEPLPPAA